MPTLLLLLKTALDYKAWADRRTLDAVGQLGDTSPPDTLAFARQQLNHMVRVEELFRARLHHEPEPHDSTNTETLPSLAALDARLMASNQWLQDYFTRLTAEQADAQVCFTFVDGQRGTLTRAEIIYHLINHATYHRGAIGHALDRAGASRPADTYTVFVHAAEPARRSLA